MKLQEILSFIDNNKLKFKLLNYNNDELVIQNIKTSKKYLINIDKINEFDELNLNRILEGGDPQCIDGITRIVGYFSKTSNWNKSKIGELHDRREGNYKI